MTLICLSGLARGSNQVTRSVRWQQGRGPELVFLTGAWTELNKGVP